MINDKEKKQVLKDAIEFYGVHNQTIKVMEECAELQAELARLAQDSEVCTKQYNEKQLITEIADVEIMLWQLKEMYKLHDKVLQEKDYKIRRLEERLDDVYPVKKNENAYPEFCSRSATCKNYCPCICDEQCEYERNKRVRK